MVVVEMHHDIIIGREWFGRHDVLIDYKRRNLIWPDKRQEYLAAHEIALPKELLEEQTPDPEHQKDAERRDRAIDAQLPPTPLPQPTRILQRPVAGKQTYETQRREALQRMDSELKKAGVETDAQRPLPATRKKPVRTQSQQKLYRAD